MSFLLTSRTELSVLFATYDCANLCALITRENRKRSKVAGIICSIICRRTPYGYCAEGSANDPSLGASDSRDLRSGFDPTRPFV
jgi:hypothetical protein